eukprot:gnl/MRDRNA2_/MRDRNA2_87054_c0_seq1.p1 gnl/MRDRNA2_/MRDRNA2_87054_c0~~gnl/MRDRNA2_/MRDRNA2_87054_c0_seq1.p1  ORF type:complete len:324 (-),score=102.55 gnl/MRDRNA2_/MRDRNA2_87054_c0_seq1:26-910(-)
MACIRTLLMLVVAVQAARQQPAQKKLAVASKNATLSKAEAEEKVMETCMGKMFDMMQSIDQQKNAAKCEKEGKYVENVIADIQKEDDTAAKAQVETLFTKCAGQPKDCADRAAPQLIEMLRLSGAAVSKKCRDEIKKPQEDEKLMMEAGNCDQKSNISEHTLSALDAGNLTAARSFSEQALVQCMHISKDCAHQAAPAFLNTAMMHVMEERAMEQMLNSQPIMVIQPVIMVEGPMVQEGPHKKSLSLLSMAASTHKKQFRRANVRGAKTTALLQVGTHQGPWISELLVKLATKH